MRAAESTGGAAGNGERRALSPARSAQRDGAVGSEWEMLQELLRLAPSPIAREYLQHYYVSAKSWSLVLLVGRPGANLTPLFDLLAEGISGCSERQIRRLPAQFAWQRPAGNVRAFDSIRGRFHTMAFLDLIEEVAAPESQGQAFFLCLEETTLEDLNDYTNLYLASPQSETSPPLPSNLYFTAMVSIAGGIWRLPPALLDRVGVIDVTVPLGVGGLARYCPPVGWQRIFLRSSVRDRESAQGKLERIGAWPLFQDLLPSLQAYLPPDQGTAFEDRLLLYAANSFSEAGEGLLERERIENLCQATDLQLSQWLLPRIGQSPAWDRDAWERLMEYLNSVFPRAYARAQRILWEVVEGHPQAV